ncbi:MAG: hypothetical protein KDD33_12500 [Bdellovibrionales bacterium]|nr:hypothetical protein [Bdellovibrionales bacterium]
MGRILLILLLLTLTAKSLANSCCGQSPASFTVLSLEQRLSLNTSYSLIQSQGRVYDSQDFFVWKDKKREIESLKINLASSFASRHQAFLSSALLRGSYSDPISSESSQHFSDTQIGYTYEALPEYRFSYWKPVVYFSLLGNIPTGKSIYDSSRLSEGTDVTGHNQWGLGLGITLRKVYFPLTITFQAKSLKIFSKTFESLEVSDFYDSSLALLFNYALNFQQLALNFGFTTNQLSNRKITTSQIPSGVMQSTTTLMGLQRTFGDAWSAGLNYSDQTLLGNPKNTLLNRTLSFNINYNYF